MATIKNASPFLPTSIPNCALWLDAADTTSIVLSGSSVSQWRDKSGTGNHMNQYSAATAPTTSNLNGINTVYFYTSDPTNVQYTPPFTNVQVLQGTNFQTTVNSTLFLVVYPLYVATSTKFIVNLKSRASNQWNNLYDINMGTGDGTNAGGFGSFIRTDTSYLGVNSSYYTINSTNLTSAEIVGTTVAFYKDASLYRSGTVSLAMPASDNYQVFTLGGYLNTDVYDTTSKMGARAHFCEVLVYNGSLTTSQRQQVEGYLAWKWGTVGSLPTGHPFKTMQIAPFVYPIQPTRPKKSALPSFDLQTFSGCTLWLNASLETAANGAFVNTIQDRSSSSYTVTPVSNNTVTLLREGLNGLPVYNLGVNRLTIGTFNWRTKFTIVLVSQCDSKNMLISLWNGGYVTYVQHANWYLMQASGVNLRDSAYAYDAGIWANSTEWSIAIWQYDLTGSPNAWRLNGTARSTSVISGTPSTSDTIQSATLYLNGNNSITNGSARIAEYLHFNNTFSTAQVQQIEGYLAWKWGLQRNLPSNHPYSQAPFNSLQLPALVKSKIARFSPTQISGCQLWLDAADTSTLTLSGTSVTQWRDKSDNQNHFSSALVSTSPTTGKYNGLTTIYWTNTNQQLTSSKNNATSGNASRSMFVLQYNPLATSQLYLVTGTESGGNPATAWGYGKNPNADYSYPFLYSSIGADVYTFVQIRNIPTIVASTFDGSSVNGWINSEYQITKSTSLNTTAGVWYLGRRQQAATGSVDSYFLEIIHYNSALTTAQRQQVEGYLAWKWGFAASLPSTHPYVKFPPPP